MFRFVALVLQLWILTMSLLMIGASPLISPMARSLLAQGEIGTQDQTSNLELVADDFPDGYWYCHVDDAGGIRLYDNFQDAVNGGRANALELVAPSLRNPFMSTPRTRTSTAQRNP